MSRRPGRRGAWSFATLFLVLGACRARPATIESTSEGDAEQLQDVALLDVLTFNVAGLPSLVAKVDGRDTHPRIGPAIADFDLVLLQEDFWYHELIDAPHAWQARPRRGELFRLGDGLACFSKLRLDPVEHVPWATAHGWFSAYHDRWAWKGFAVGRVWITGDAWIWVYNVHFDAGGARGDREARERQREQLLADIHERTTPEDALIVAGDFNTGRSGLSDFRELASLQDAGVGGIDRVLFRSGARVALRLTPEASRPTPDLDALRGLSDHSAVWARFGVQVELDAE